MGPTDKGQHHLTGGSIEAQWVYRRGDAGGPTQSSTLKTGSSGACRARANDFAGRLFAGHAVAVSVQVRTVSLLPPSQRRCPSSARLGAAAEARALADRRP